MIKKLYYSTAYKEEEDFINKQKDHLKNFKKIVETLKSYKIQESILKVSNPSESSKVSGSPDYD